LVFLKHGQDSNVDMSYYPDEVLRGTSKRSSKALHIARAKVSGTLLEHGAHVNALDSYGLTGMASTYPRLCETHHGYRGK
jgi:hypothetical protein